MIKGSSSAFPASPPVGFDMPARSVLVTGGTGFVGQALIGELLASGHRVTVLTRDPGAAPSSWRGRVNSIATLQEYPKDTRCELVVNLAGARIVGPRWTANRQQVLMQSRQGLTDRLVDWIGSRPDKPAMMLSASAIGYYGIQPQGDAASLNEESPPQPIFMSRLCSAWEQSAQRATQHGVTVCCMRFGVVLGREGGSLTQLLLPIKLGLGGRLGTGQQIMSWIHLHDLLRAMAHLCKRGVSTGRTASVGGAYNFTAPDALTQEAFGHVAADALHRPFWSWIPQAPVRLALGEQADLLLEGQRVAPKRLLESGFEFTYPNARSALAELCR